MKLRKTLTVAAVIATCFQPPRAVAEGELPSPKLKEVVISALKNEARDPTSLLFKWHAVAAEPKGGVLTYCGMVNGKNGFGGYSGFAPYLAAVVLSDSGEPTKAIIIGMKGKGQDKTGAAAVKICANYGYDVTDPATLSD